MPRKFNRLYELRIGDRVIKDLRVRFNVEYQIGGFIPLFELDIYNLKKETVNEFFTHGQFFEFSAGYPDNLPVIFKGEMRNVFTLRDDVDVITSILAGGNDLQLRETDISIRFENPTSLKEIIKGILSAAKMDFGEILVKEKKIIKSYEASGNLVYVMNVLAKGYEFNWFVYNNLFYAYDEKLYPNRAIYKISSNTGLLETPILTDQGIDIRMLLEPSIRPHDRYEVESQGLASSQTALQFSEVRNNVKGQQSVFEVSHLGDTRTDQWYTELRGLAVES